MDILNQYGRGSGLSVCFCVLQITKEVERKLYQIQQQMSESDLKIRQSYVYGDQTVNAVAFSRFLPNHYTKIEKSTCEYPAHEALILAAGMMQKEKERIRRKDREEEWTCLLLILGEETALKQKGNRTGAYQTVKQWVLDQKSEFAMEVV